MSRRSHLPISLLFCLLFAVSFLAPQSSSQSTLRSLLLNGTTAYAEVPNHTSLNISGAITVEAWIKVNAIDGSQHDIVSRIDRNTAGSGGGYAIAVNGAGKVRLDLFQSHNTYTTVIGTTVLSAGAWHHVAGVFSGSQMRVYVNGVLDGSLNTANGPGSGTSLLRIGRAAHVNGPPLYLPSYAFAGLIDEVRVSAAALYSSNFTPGLGPGSNVRGLWKFDGQTASDSSGNNNNGALQGGATYATDVPPANNNAPTVSLVHPLNNTAIASGSNIVMDGTATDSDGSVSKVDFYQGATLLGTDTAAPYTFIWTNVPVGSYSLTAKATDDGNATTTSSAIAVSVLAPGGQHSLLLNGTTAYAEVPNHTSLNISGAITVEAWIRVNAIDGSQHDIVSRIDRNTAGSGGGYAIAVNGAGKVRLDLFQSHNTYTTVIGTTVLSAGAWHHVAGVFSGSQMRVYVNGVLDGSLNTTNGPGSGTSLLRIGRAAHANGPPLYLPSYAFAGLIDEVRVSAAALYSSNFTPGLGPGSNVRGLWQFDAQTPSDFSGNGNHATLQGGASYSTNVPTTVGPQRPVPAAGGPYSGELSQSVQFSSSGSFDPDGSIASYHWHFGDGTSANTANPAHTYAAPGLYTATLTVTDNAGLLAGATAPVTISSNGVARLDSMNQTGGGGENPLSRNFNWSLPLVNLPGRAGMDLGLSLSYNSLVWTRSGNYISFDEDRGFPGPGFRLGFPVIQPLYYNSEVGKYAFLLISPDGSRTELRQVGSSALFEAADSSYLLLDSNTMVLRTTDGTQLTYVLMGNEFNCTQIKDRNGNYITINYTSFGRIDTVIDTLARSIKFNYDANGRLTSITQIWNQGQQNEVTHNWARFEYASITIDYNFGSLTASGLADNSSLTMPSRVKLADDSYFDFSYTSWGQVWKVSHSAPDDHLLNYRAYKLPGSPLLATSPQSDCPRFTERRDWAQYWNGDTDGSATSSEEAVTTFAIPVSDTWTMPDGSPAVSGTRAQVTTPDGTSNKIYFIGTAGTLSGWQRGLPALVDTYDSGGVIKRQATTTWEQDDDTSLFELNPRIKETNIYDPAGNRRRIEITYLLFTPPSGSSYKLPQNVLEYAADASTVLRSTQTVYVDGDDIIKGPYLSRRILGLPKEKKLYEGSVTTGVLMSRVAFNYDESGSIQGTAAPIQHDNTNYTASFVTGRGNLSSVKRHNVTNTSFTTTSSKYNTAGAVVSAKDALNHEVLISYTDSFSDDNPRNTLAYPTTVTDPDGFSSTAKYHFDLGAVTYRQTPQPSVTTNTPGPEQTFTYDVIGRLIRTTSLTNSAFTRYNYGPNYIETFSSIKSIVETANEGHTLQVFDGLGRIIGNASDHPNSTGGFSAQIILYDRMGRVQKRSNPTETSISINGSAINPTQFAPLGDDAPANGGFGWKYTEQTYDWKGRPLVTTNQDGTTRTALYSGCGCAGGEVVTLTDEGTTVDIDSGPAVNNVTKKRQRKIYSDALGRTVKTEILNWQSGSVYSTAVMAYNARDQVQSVRQYQGTEASAVFQEASTTYDGFGRVKTRKVPEQKVDANITGSTDHTTWEYNSDDTVQSVTDARGITTTFGYNTRHLLTSISYPPAQNLPPGTPTTSNVTYSYDAAGNRTSMSDVSGNDVAYNYDSLSRLSSEARQFAGLSGTFTLAYEYNFANQVKAVTDQSAGTSFGYVVDNAGRLSTVTSTGLGASASLASNARYRASGALKQWEYGNGTEMNLAYNNRGLIAQYSLSGVKEANGAARVEGSDFQYHADGQVKFASDFYGRSFSTSAAHDKAYQRDQAGRLQVAVSGVEANDFLNNSYSGAFHGPAPYLQSYTHDVWNNLLGRTGSYWSETDDLEQQTYNAHNRNSAWSYDADGRLLSMNESPPDELPFVPAQHTYDAAGRHVKHTQTTSRLAPTGNPVWTTVVTVDASYDGEGQQYKRVEKTQINSQQPTIETRFLLRSTVLGGQVVTEYDGLGGRQKSYVYGGGALITSGPSEGLVWRFNNPVTGDGRETDGLGRVTKGSYIDSQGVDVGASDPANNQGEPPPPDPLPRAGAYSAYLPHSLGGSGRCSVDGAETGCALVDALLGSQAAEECPNNECSRYNPNLNGGRGGHEYFRSYSDGRSFYLPAGVNWTGNGFSLPGGLSLSFVDGIPNHFKDGRLDPQNTKSDCGTFVDNLVNFSHQYQHHGEVDIGRGFLGMIPKDQSERERHYAQTKVSGFKDRFVAPVNYQGGWVHAHVLGIVGGTLIGNSTIYPWPFGKQTGSQLVEAQMEQDRKELADVEYQDLLGFPVYDYYGQLRPLKDVLTERRSEVASNEAAQSIGYILSSAIRGKSTFDQPRSEIFSLLCDR